MYIIMTTRSTAGSVIDQIRCVAPAPVGSEQKDAQELAQGGPEKDDYLLSNGYFLRRAMQKRVR